jgi:hypothetical protein
MLPADRAPAYPTQYAGEPTFLCLGKFSSHYINASSIDIILDLEKKALIFLSFSF